MTWMTGVFDNFWGLSLTSPSMSWMRHTVGCRAVDMPGSDAAGQDALVSSAFEVFEYLGTRVKYF